MPATRSPFMRDGFAAQSAPPRADEPARCALHRAECCDQHFALKNRNQFPAIVVTLKISDAFSDSSINLCCIGERCFL